MKTKKYLIVVTGLMAVLGAASMWLEELCAVYVFLSSLLLVLVTIGGLTEYNSRHMRDFREVYREKDLMRKEREQTLRDTINSLKAQLGETKHPEKC